MSKILAFSGSNSSVSINQQLVTAVSDLTEKHEVEVISLKDFEAPLFGTDLLQDQGVPESMQALFGKIQEADGFIISTPEHNGSMPAVLKNTIDWLSMLEQKIFGEKPTLFLSTSPGPRGAITSLEHLVSIMPYRGAKVIDSYSLGSFGEFFKEGKLSPEKESEIKPLILKLEDQIS